MLAKFLQGKNENGKEGCLPARFSYENVVSPLP